MGNPITQEKHNNKTITIMDYTNCSKPDLLKRVDEIRAWVAKQPESSLLTLTDVTGVHFDKDVVEAFKQIALDNAPHVKAGAIIGMGGLQKIAYTTIMKFSKRNMPACNSREDAIKWLSGQ